MATKTTNYGMNKPAVNDAADISVLNSNFDILDAYAMSNQTKQIDDWNKAIYNGLYSSSGSAINGPVAGSQYHGMMINYSSVLGNQFVFKTWADGISEIWTRRYYNGAFGAWHPVLTDKNIGTYAAPSGYGYGGGVPYVSVSDMWTDSSYNTALNDLLSGMADGEAKQIRIPYIDGTTTLGTVYRATNDYATVVCYGYGTHGFIARKSKYNGFWSNWEWENPPMQPGVEYCTTERYQGNPVYVKLIDVGTLPNNSTKYVESAIVNGITKVVDVKLNMYSGSGMAQRTNDSRIIVTVNVESPFAWLAITANENFSTYTGQVVVKYIK